MSADFGCQEGTCCQCNPRMVSPITLESEGTTSTHTMLAFSSHFFAFSCGREIFRHRQRRSLAQPFAPALRQGELSKLSVHQDLDKLTENPPHFFLFIALAVEENVDWFVAAVPALTSRSA